MAAQCLFMLLLLLIVKGWTITRMTLPTLTKLILFTVWTAYTAASVALFIWNQVSKGGRTRRQVLHYIASYHQYFNILTVLYKILINVCLGYYSKKEIYVSLCKIKFKYPSACIMLYGPVKIVILFGKCLIHDPNKPKVKCSIPGPHQSVCSLILSFSKVVLIR